MRLCTCPTTATKYAGISEVAAGARVVMPDTAAASLEEAGAKHGFAVRVSSLGHYTRHYSGQDLAGKTLVTWRGHGIGDQMVWAGMLQILNQRRPGGRILYYFDPRLTPLWRDLDGLPFEPRPLPIPFDDVWTKADYHLLGEGLVESDKEPDQPSMWDGHLRFAGLDPAAILACHQRPLVPINAEDRDLADKWRHDHGLALDRKDLVLWHLAATSQIRSLHPERTRAVLSDVCAALADSAQIVLIGSRSQIELYRPFPACANLHVADDISLRTGFALLESASALVAPDSCFGHAAAALDIPCVSLWASFAPADRVAPYRSHYPIYFPGDCGPCRSHEAAHARLLRNGASCLDRLDPNSMGCPLPNRTSPWCAQLSQIPASAIISQLKEALQ